MPERPLVSVIVPVFNGARFLRECLQSIRAQDYTPVECLVVDDGSDDESAAIAQSFDGVRVLRRPHEGLAATRNAGVEESCGELVGFCDADDTWKPEKARRQVEYLAAHPETSVVLCRQDTVFDDGAEWPDWLVPDQVYGDLDGVSATSGLFRRAVFDRLGGFHLDMEAGTDFNLLVRMRTAGMGIAVIEDSLRTRRIHDDNMTSRLGPARAEMFQSIREHRRALTESRRLVSVVIPVYRRAFCVDDAVRSVLDQQGVRVECIVVDDGSEDGTLEALRAAYATDHRVRVFTQQHAGVSAARNHGIREARGSVVTFLDSDDVMPAGRIARQLDLLEAHPGSVIVGTYEPVLAPGVAVPSWVTGRTRYYWTSALVETRRVRAIGGFDEAMLVGEDLDILVRLVASGVAVHAVDEVFTVHRFFGDNLTLAIADPTPALHEAVRRHRARARGT